MQEAIICDLDGTLALFGDKNPYDRDYENDYVNIPVWTVIESILCWRNATVIFTSGRKEKSRTVTHQWLLNVVGILDDFELYMRADRDNRADNIVKKDMYEKYIKPYYNVIAVFDDRNKVVKMWREIGLTCFQVAEGDF